MSVSPRNIPSNWNITPRIVLTDPEEEYDPETNPYIRSGVFAEFGREKFFGTEAEFKAYIAIPTIAASLDSGAIISGGAGVIVTHLNVTGYNKHVLTNGSASEDVTIQVTFNPGESAPTWLNADALNSSGTLINIIPAMSSATLRGSFGGVRLSAADVATGRIVSSNE